MTLVESSKACKNRDRVTRRYVYNLELGGGRGRWIWDGLVALHNTCLATKYLSFYQSLRIDGWTLHVCSSGLNACFHLLIADVLH